MQFVRFQDGLVVIDFTDVNIQANVRIAECEVGDTRYVGLIPQECIPGTGHWICSYSSYELIGS
jgi:hypothetical protein